MQAARRNSDEVIRVVFLGILSRYPTPAEQDAVVNYSRNAGLNAQQIGEDLIWALFNTKEFLYRH